MTPEEIRAAFERIRATLEQIRAWRRDPGSQQPSRYYYPDQSIATMTPEQAGEVVESFRMDMAEAERDCSGS